MFSPLLRTLDEDAVAGLVKKPVDSSHATDEVDVPAPMLKSLPSASGAGEVGRLDCARPI